MRASPDLAATKSDDAGDLGWRSLGLREFGEALHRLLWLTCRGQRGLQRRAVHDGGQAAGAQEVAIAGQGSTQCQIGFDGNSGAKCADQ